MNNLVWRIFVGTLCSAVLFLNGVSAWGQVRRNTGVTIKRPGTLQRVGAGQNYDFRHNSAGGGGLQSSRGGSHGGGVLRSAMFDRSRGGGRGMRSTVGGGNKGGTDILRSKIDLNTGGLTGASGSHLGATSEKLGSVRIGLVLADKGGSALMAGPGVGGGGMASTVLGRSTSLAAARGFVASIGHSGSLDGSDESVRTLVPDRPGLYRDKMYKGEERLKAGSFRSAYENFKLASDMVGRFPEPYLNMAHAKFGTNGYGMTAFYIRRALVCMPSLPQVQLRPKSFYRSVAVFGDLVIRLEGYLDDNPGDGDALLILAYFRWFTDNPDVPAVRSMLERALAVAKSEDRTEAIQIFWRAIVASKKATGALRTAGSAAGVSSDIKSTTRPSGKAPGSADKTPESPVVPPKTSDPTGAQSR